MLRAEHLGPGAAVLDATQPRNTGPELQRQRPDVLLLDGGIVEVPGLRLHGGTMGLPDGRTFACLAETMLLSLSGHQGHFTIGRPTLDQIDHITELAAAPQLRLPAGGADHLRPARECTRRRSRKHPHPGRRSDDALGAGMTTTESIRLAPIRVVMIGGGYATLHAYRSLVRGAGSAGILTITVVSADDHHNFHGFTGEVVAGLLPLIVTRTPLTEVMPRARVVHGRVVRVDLAQRAVIVQDVSDGAEYRGAGRTGLLLLPLRGRVPASSSQVPRAGRVSVPTG